MTDDEIEALDQSNEKRQIDLFLGHSGAKIAVPPGTFENVRITTYLEGLFSPEGLRAAKQAAGEKIAEMLDAVEEQARQLAIAQGQPAGGAVDLAAVSNINRQLERKKK